MLFYLCSTSALYCLKFCFRSYDEGKRAAETLAFDYHREHGVEIRVARIFNTFGPRMNLDDGRVVSNFITQALQVVHSLSRVLHLYTFF